MRAASARIVPMYIDEVPNRNSRPAILLREGWREGKKVRKRTLANLSDWPREKVESFRRLLKDEPLIGLDDAFDIERSIPHGHVRAVLGTMRRIGLAKLIAPRRSQERDLVMAMVAQRILHPCSKLDATRRWNSTTLASELGVEDADEDDCYLAMDWLLAQQERIEARLARRHLVDGGLALYDVSSSYYEGRHCSLAQRGHDRDGKKGKTIIVYGLMTDEEGRPIAIDVYPGNTSDSTTVPEQVDKLRIRFGLERTVLVGDRGMLTQTQITKIREHPGLGWISALRSKSIRKLVDGGDLQLSLFDEQNLAEISSPEFPGERLMACFNPLLAAERQRKRLALLAATEKDLDAIAREVARRTKKILTKDEIGLKIGKVLNRYKVGKHFKVEIGDGKFSYSRHETGILRESELDGIYVVRTSEDRRSAEDTVRHYKNLSQVEQAFRCLKTIDLRIRPIGHRLADRVRAHVFLTMLAYYVDWHMRKALAPLLFEDEELEDDRWTRDPVAPATPSKSAKDKKHHRRRNDGTPIHSFGSLLADLGTLCRNRCRFQTVPSTSDSPVIYRDTLPTPLQKEAFDLLGIACSQ